MSTPAQGRRIAARQRRRPDGTALTGVVLVVLSLVLLVAADLVTADPRPPARVTAVTVDEVAVACAAASQARGRREVFTLAADLPGTADGGAVEAGPVGGERAPLSGARGQRVAVGLRGAAALPVAVTATGEQALGRATFQADRAPGDRQLAVQDCAQPRSEWWFTGAGAGLDHSSELLLVNTDPGPAVVDVVALGPEGVVDSVGTRGITVAPGEVERVDLLDVAPQAEEIAVQVRASRGRVVAALSDTLSSGAGVAAGREWIPAQGGPTREVRLTPLPLRADRRTLVVANPSGREALVEVELAGESGTFVPTGLEPLRVPPGAVVTADLAPAVGRDASAVLLHSPVPVTATVRSVSGVDHTYAAAVRPLRRPAAAVLPTSTAALHLTAGDRGGAATVTTYAADGQRLSSAEVTVPAASTFAQAMDPKAASVLVTPSRGRVWGGVTLGGQGVSQVLLRPLPVTLRRPPVVPVVR